MNKMQGTSEKAGTVAMPQEGDRDFSFMMLFINILKSLKKLWWMALIWVVALAALFFAVSKIAYKSRYRATITFSVSPLVKGNEASGLSVYYFNYNETLAQQTVATFVPVLESDFLKEIVENDLGRPMKSTVTASSIGTTNIFELTVESSTAQDAYEVAGSLVKNYPKLTEYILGDTRVHVISQAELPKIPYNRNDYLKYTALGAFLGLVAAAATATFYTLFHNGVCGRRDVMEKLNQRCVCEIPFVEQKETEKKEGMLRLNSRYANFSEAIRSLRKRINDEIEIKDVKVIAVTSAAFGEGKTTIAYNLAASMANGGRRVLLMDMDFRHRALQTYLKKEIKSSVGISDVITGKASLSPEMIHEVEGFHVLLSGNETIKFQKQQFEGLFSYARSAYDCVIVDMPASGVASESALIADLCDLLLFVVQADHVSAEKITNAIRYISFSRAELIGVVLNRVMFGFGEYDKYKSYNHYSRYGYGRNRHGYAADRYNNYGG